MGIFRGTLRYEALVAVDSTEPDAELLADHQVMAEIAMRRWAAWILGPVAAVVGAWVLYIMAAGSVGAVVGTGWVILWLMLGMALLAAFWTALTTPRFTSARWALLERARRLLGLPHFHRRVVVRERREVPVEIVLDEDQAVLRWHLDESARRVLSRSMVPDTGGFEVRAAHPPASGGVSLGAMVAFDLGATPEGWTLAIVDARTRDRLTLGLSGDVLEGVEGAPRIDRPAVALPPEAQDLLLARLLPLAVAGGAHLPPALERRALAQVTVAASVGS